MDKKKKKTFLSNENALVTTAVKTMFQDEVSNWKLTDFSIGMVYFMKRNYRVYQKQKTQMKEEDFFKVCFLPHFIKQLQEYALLADASYEKTLQKLMTATSFDKQQLIVYKFRSSTFRPAYFLAVNDIQKEVYLAIRGTKSMTDCLTDLNGMMCKFSDGFGHNGMVNAALWMEFHLKKKISEIMEQKKNYKLVLIGHSLGGGVASLLTILLSKSFPKIHCYGFGTPSVFESERSKTDGVPNP
eukprot:Anaeramoba_ignava/c19781_g3_i2.p1 GENE.c19781_g3_i2~~c19781_g3_i2.p1  ORF type:complete len:252 (+),score=71.31 c19781_g3_i2:32-757(+)